MLALFRISHANEEETDTAGKMRRKFRRDFACSVPILDAL